MLGKYVKLTNHMAGKVNGPDWESIFFFNDLIYLFKRERAHTGVGQGAEGER